MRCYSPKSLLRLLVFRRGAGEYIPPSSGLLLNRYSVSWSSPHRKMPSALCESYQNRCCSVALSSFERWARLPKIRSMELSLTAVLGPGE